MMQAGEWDKQSLINASAVEILLADLRRGEQTLRVGDAIHLDLALQALQKGVSLAEIVRHAIEQLEKMVIIKMLAASGGNKAEVARLLKIDYKTLYRKLKKHFGMVGETGSEPDELKGDVKEALWLTRLGDRRQAGVSCW